MLLTGPLPWDDLSSSEDEFSPRPGSVRAVHAVLEKIERSDMAGPISAGAAKTSLTQAASGLPAKDMALPQQIPLGAQPAQAVHQVCTHHFA